MNRLNYLCSLIIFWDWHFVYGDGKNWPKTGKIAVRASKSSEGGVRGVIWVLLSTLSTRCMQAEMVGISKYKCTVCYWKKLNPANYLQSLNYIVDCINLKLNRFEKSSSLIANLIDKLSIIAPCFECCQVLSISFSFYLSLFISIFLYLWEIEIKLTIKSLSTTPPTINFLRTLELTYAQVWYIIGIVSSSQYDFCTENIGLIEVTFHLPCQH